MTPIERVVLSLIPISDERRVNIKDKTFYKTSKENHRSVNQQLRHRDCRSKKRTYWIFYPSNRPGATRRGIATQSASNQRVQTSKQDSKGKPRRMEKIYRRCRK